MAHVHLQPWPRPPSEAVPTAQLLLCSRSAEGLGKGSCGLGSGLDHGVCGETRPAAIRLHSSVCSGRRCSGKWPPGPSWSPRCQFSESACKDRVRAERTIRLWTGRPGLTGWWGAAQDSRGGVTRAIFTCSIGTQSPAGALPSALCLQGSQTLAAAG